MTELRVGMRAPDFTLPLATFGTVSLSNMRGKPVVLYFYPKDDTPGCTTEACNFRDTLPQFGNYDAAIIGISKDSVESHAAFAKKYEIKFHLASDAHSDTCEAYGVWTEKNNYGTKYWGIERSTFLIDQHGVIRAIWRKVKVEGHAQEILKLVELLHLGQPLPGDAPPEPVLPPTPAPAPAPAPVKAEAKKPATVEKPAPAKEKPAAKAKPAAKKPAKKAAPAPKAKAAASKAVKAKAAAKPVAAKKPAAKPSKAAPAKKPAVKAAVKAKAKATAKPAVKAKATPAAKKAAKPATKPATKKPVKASAKKKR